MTQPKLSVVVISYNMKRELPRTILSLSTKMQRDIAEDDYEIIVVDNGSSEPLDADAYLKLGGNIQIHFLSQSSPSPVAAINYGLSLAQGLLVGVFIDGARIASPRLLATALDAACLDKKPVIGSLGFHLGPEIQTESIKKGYCQAEEDKLLASVNWLEDGYRLFDISVFAASSADCWFSIPNETNSLFLTQEHWQELGGYDANFLSPGGGLVNLDMWTRACQDPKARVILLLGEATFHQVHGGVATNAKDCHPWPIFHEEYIRIRGKSFARPDVNPFFVGHLNRGILSSVLLSAQKKLL
jgi:glycosyltransferase involved in cell wall biosynthesis